MFCKFCGSKIDDNALFCSKCGSKLSDNENNQACKSTNNNTEEYYNADIITDSNLNKSKISEDTTNKTTQSVSIANQPMNSKKQALFGFFKKCCSMGFIIGAVGVALFVGIVAIGLIFYGKVYLFDGYDFTKALSITSLVLMTIGLFFVIAKFIFVITKIDSSAFSIGKKIAASILFVFCLGFSIWSYIDCSNTNKTIIFQKIYYECNCSSPWASYGDDYLFIDSNPYNLDSDSRYSTIYLNIAIDAIKAVNSALNLPSYLYDEIAETRAVDGTRAYSGKTVNVTWRYHPDKGIEIRYTLK